MRVALFVLLLLGTARIAQDPPKPDPAKVSFSRDVLPILKDNCHQCHSGEKPRGKIRLDDRDKLASLVVPGKSAESRLYRVLVAEDEGERMPRKKPALPAATIEVVRRWIDGGAAIDAGVARHWAYEKPVRPAPPVVKGARNDIDRFVIARLIKEGLALAPEASREKLLRRLSLDLNGLPPTIDELDANEDYEKTVDRLLASPRYGERMARLWLDLARYADTNGYEKDLTRTMWRWRDWVIDAFNRDLPFDQFTIEQIAGDLLPNATREQVIASGFHRNTMTNEEGGVDPEEARWERLVDRVGTTGFVWLGSTLACAQCHNHKYDPFLQREFYGMLAFYDHADELMIEAPTAETAKRREALQADLAELETQLHAPNEALDKAQAAWETAILEWTALDPEQIKSEAGATLMQAAETVTASGKNPARDTYTVYAPAALKTITAIKLDALGGRAPNGNFVLGAIKIQADGKDVAIARATADFSQDGFPVEHAFDAKAETGWAISPPLGKPHSAAFELKAPLESATTLVIRLEFQSPHAQHVIGRFRLSVTASTSPMHAPDDITAMARLEKRTDAQQKRLAAAYRGAVPALAAVRAKIAAAKKQLAEFVVPTALVFKEKSDGKRPTTNFRVRGGFLAKGDVVDSGVPAAYGQPIEGVDRLALAKWLVHPDHPLTARVMVNRLWELLFGRGRGESSEDFGTQGSRPTNPELLDWLATELITRKWSLKSLLKLIVMSATYRQSSTVTAALREKDPLNRLLARGPRVRLEAEAIRDSALTAGGLLVEKLGGPSVFPAQPEGIWDSPYSGERWMNSKGGDAHRRSLYTFWKRTAAYPSFMTFDAPSREFCTVRRVKTTTPLQALTLMNDPVYVEAANALAARMMKVTDERERIVLGFRLCTSRRPDDDEIDILLKLAAKRGWNAAAGVLLNLDETVTKE